MRFVSDSSALRYLSRALRQAVVAVLFMYLIGTVLVVASPIRQDREVELSPLARWGVSWETGQAVSVRLRSAIWPSAILFVTGTCLSLAVGVPLGVSGVLRRKHTHRHRIAAAATSYLYGALSAVPALVAGFVLLRLLAVEIRLFPLSGIESMGRAIARSTGDAGPGVLRGALDVAHHVLLPALAIAVADGSLKDVTEGAAAAVQSHRRLGYLESLELIGMTRARVVGRYFTRSALVSVLGSLRLRVPLLFGGLIVVEQVFAIPGIGRLFVRAVEYNDVPVLRALVLLLSIATGLAYLASALVVVMVDPTVRYPEEGADARA